MLIIKLIRKLFKVLNSEREPHEIALGFVIGMCLGLAPLKTLYVAALVVLFIVLRCNFTSLVLGFIIFQPLALAFGDRISNALGGFLIVSPGVIQAPILHLSGLPVLAWANLNDTLVLGGMILGWILAAPALIGMLLLVSWFRRSVSEERRARIGRAMKKFWLLRVLRRVFAGPMP